MGLLRENRTLLNAFRRGDRVALTEVYDAYVDEVMTVLRHGFHFESGGQSMHFRGLSDPLEIEALVQDVFLRAFSPHARDTYDGLRPYRPYLLQIARNRVIDELRRRRRELERLVGPLEPGDDAMAGEPPDLEGKMDRQRARQLVDDFLSERSELEQRFVAARFASDLSLLAAARELGITRMRARLLEAKLMRDLRRFLRGKGFLEHAVVFSSGVFVA